jgi:hypothetical protein
MWLCQWRPNFRQKWRCKFDQFVVLSVSALGVMGAISRARGRVVD